MTSWGAVQSDELIKEFTEFLSDTVWDFDEIEGWTIGPREESYKGPRVGFSDYDPAVHTKSFPGWAEGLWDDGQIVFTHLEYQDAFGIECRISKQLMDDLRMSDHTTSPIINGLHWNHDITSMWGTYRVVNLERGENGAIAKVVPFVFDDRLQPYTFPKWNHSLNMEQLHVAMESPELLTEWVKERATLMVLIGGPPMTLYIEDDVLAGHIDGRDFSDFLLCLPEPTHHVILDNDSGEVARTVSMKTMADWLVVDYDLDRVPTMIGNISNVIGDWYEHGTTFPIEVERRTVGTHPTEWRPVWKDKRKSKRIGMAGLSDKCYHHGFVRCSACNGEVEYCFGRRIETETYKCPHCSTEDAVEIPTLIPFIHREEVL